MWLKCLETDGVSECGFDYGNMSRKEIHDEKLVEQLAWHYKEILKLIGEDPEREGLKKTPIRTAKALIDITAGYQLDPVNILQKAIFSHSGSQMVIVRDIEFYSVCEHHILPFFGTVSIGYLPDGKIVGLSKIARVANAFARRLQVQERLTEQICDTISKAFPNKGVIVKCTAQHLCMKMRGVESQNASTVTFASSGEFSESPDLRREFLELIS